MPADEVEGSLCQNADAVRLLYQASECLRAERLTEAEAFAHAAEALAPRAEAVQYLSGCISQERKDCDDAARRFALVSQSVPHFAGPYYRLASCLRVLKRHDEAPCASALPKGGIEFRLHART